jgi:D-alanyl-D-alanine carboxypeptidase
MSKIFLLLIILSACKQEVKSDLSFDVNQKKRDTVITETRQAEKKLEIKEVYNFDKDFVLGKFNYKTDSTFIKAEPFHSAKTLNLKKETYLAFVKMYNHAMEDGILLKIISGTRNFYEQKAIWERKWKKYNNLKPLSRATKILEYSSMPSTSRHHWGTDLDLNHLNNSYFESGNGLKEYDWLVANASKYGFYQAYTDKLNGRTGYNLEKWHWSYLPLSSQYLKFYNENVTFTDISGFEGSELAKDLNVIIDYVNGINSEIKK